MRKTTLLVVEDDESIRTQLKYALRDEYTLAFAGDRAEALAALRSGPPDLVSLDLGLPPSPDTAEEGLRTLEEILRLAPETKVMVVTGNSDRENAHRAIRHGAFDYYAKPIELEEFKVILRRAAHLGRLEQETETWLRGQEDAIRFEEILGATPAMREIFRIIQRVAKSDATVLVQGESGTGKELIARAIHRRSPRGVAPFVAINCGAIPETLLEAELFGHERGAFTGAHVQRKGRVELVAGGTLFLDEIGELSPMLQVKLLRFLQERTIERVGGRELIPVDTRIIAATNRDLKVELQRGGFREDLYYRLSVVAIQVPPLRERGEDIIVLANAFLRRVGQEQRRRLRFSPGALQAVLAHRWPGNIRELENRVSRAVIMARGGLIVSEDLDLKAAEQDRTSSLRETRDEAEREALVETLARHGGNISRAARELQISRPTLHGLLERHGVNAKDFRGRSASARDAGAR
jgi:two-component system, NtrC family, response regulator